MIRRARPARCAGLVAGLLLAALAHAVPQEPGPADPAAPPVEPLRTADEDFEHAQLLLADQRFDEADVHLQLALHKNDLDPRSHHALGRLRLTQRRYDEAIESFSRALALNPRAPDVHQDLALAHQAKGDREGALAALRHAVEFHSRDERLWFQIGNLLDALGRPQEALQAYVEATYRFPLYAEAYRAIGRVYRDLGNLDKALLFTEQAARLNPLDLDALFQVGRLYLIHRRDPERARDPLETVLRYDPGDLESLQLLVWVYHALEDPARADEARQALWRIAQTSRRVSVKPAEEYILEERRLADGRTLVAWAPIRYEAAEGSPVRFQVQAREGGDPVAAFRLDRDEGGPYRLAQTAPASRALHEFGVDPPPYRDVRELVEKRWNKESPPLHPGGAGNGPDGDDAPQGRPDRRR